MLTRTYSIAVAIVAFFLTFGQLQPVQAFGICKCCASDVGGTCKPVCEDVGTRSAICRPAVVLDASLPVNNDLLYTENLQGLTVGDATRMQLEKFRIRLERYRNRVEHKFRHANRAWQRRRISEGKFLAAQAKRDVALVNYYHAMQAYIDAVRRF